MLFFIYLYLTRNTELKIFLKSSPTFHKPPLWSYLIYSTDEWIDAGVSIFPKGVKKKNKEVFKKKYKYVILFF
jgi:hypothetical protein